MTRQSNTASTAGSTAHGRKPPYREPDYIDNFLSLFERTPKPVKQSKVVISEETVSTENLLRKTQSIPSVKSVALSTQGQPWSSGVARRIPYSGGLALLAVLSCAVADAIILWKSDGQVVDSWTVSPSVLLAILSAVANVCLQYAHSQGVVIAWWRKALHGGRLVELHQYWESGNGIWVAATSVRGFNRISLATLAASAVVFDGPLLQRASNIVSKSVTTTVNVTAPIADELPYGYTGYGQSGSDSFPYDSTVMNKTFAKVFKEYTLRSPILTDFTRCTGNCSGTVKAAGLAVNCSAYSVPWIGNTSYFVGENVFSSSFNWIPSAFVGIGTYPDGYNPFPDEPFIDFSLQYVTGRKTDITAHQVGVGGTAVGNQETTGACNGTKVIKRCSMRSATLEYPISMVDNTATIFGNSSHFVVDHIQPVGNKPYFFNYHDINPMAYTTLGGVVKAAQSLFNSMAIQIGRGVSSNGSLAGQYLDYGTGNMSYFASSDVCAINWNDPTADVVDALNEIMFRTALVAANVSKYSIINDSMSLDWTNFYEAYPVNITGTGIPEPQVLFMQQIADKTVFESNYAYLAAALALMLLGVLVVVPTFHGFWELGRSVSLNPLEVAKAFNAAMLQGDGSNASVSHLMKEVGDREVKYGEVMIDEKDKMMTDQGLGIARLGNHRLEIAEPTRVVEPKCHKLYM